MTLRSFSEALEGAKPIANLASLHSRFALDDDPVLIPATGGAGPLKTSDALALLAFQIDDHTFAVAAYVVTPNIAQAMKPVRATLQFDRKLQSANLSTIRPATLERAAATVVDRGSTATTIALDLYDDVVWLRLSVE